MKDIGMRTKTPEICPKCGGPRVKAKYNWICQPCANQFGRSRYLNFKEQESERRKTYYYNNKDKYLAVCEIYRKNKKHPLRQTWSDMRQRCLNQKYRQYADYGGRGITICDRWMESFDNFLEDMGEKPTKRHTLERIDNNKGYSKDNCKWATRKEQMNNTRRSHAIYGSLAESTKISVNGVDMTLVELSELTGIHIATITYRYLRNCNVEWILSDDVENRDYSYHGNNYSLAELQRLSSISYPALCRRIQNYGWDVERAVEEPSRVGE